MWSGKTRESFEAFPTAELGEGKKEKDRVTGNMLISLLLVEVNE